MRILLTVVLEDKGSGIVYGGEIESKEITVELPYNPDDPSAVPLSKFIPARVAFIRDENRSKKVLSVSHMVLPEK